MSKDLKIEKICDHQIVQEQLHIDSDLKTIRIPRTLSSQNVELWINGYKIPKNNSIFEWSIQTDELSLYTKRSKIVFKDKQKAPDNFYFVTYYVQSQFCPKCEGLRILNDISYSTLGKPVIVENEAKLLQEVKKGLTTYLGSNPFHSWYGTEINKMVGAKVFNTEVIKAKMIQEVYKFVEKYIDIQIQQSQYQDVTDREAFLTILAVDVSYSTDDLSYWTISVIFKNRTGEDMLYTKEIQIPGPTNLLSTS